MRREVGVVEDGCRCYGGVVDSCFDALRGGVAGDGGAFCCGEGGGNADVGHEWFGRLAFMVAVEDDFGGVDGGAAAERDERVDERVFGDLVGGLVELSNGGVLLDVGEGAGVVGGAKEGLDGLDEGCLCGEGGACDDEGFGLWCGKGGEEVLGDD